MGLGAPRTPPPPFQWQHIASIRYGSLGHVQLVQQRDVDDIDDVHL